MSLKRKTRSLTQQKVKEKSEQFSFYEPVSQSDQIADNDEPSDAETISKLSKNPVVQRTSNVEDDSAEISTVRIVGRIKQIQQSIEQAQTMLNSMEQFKSLVPGSEEQCDKLRVIIDNLSEQQQGYVNLLNLISLTNDERTALMKKLAAENDQIDEEEQIVEEEDDEEVAEEEEEEEEETDRRKLNRSPIRPRIESKIGFTGQAATPSTPTNAATVQAWEVDGFNRNDNSNYDSLVGSLKSDTLNWKDQQSTTDDEATDAESEKEIEKSLLFQKEQLRALQGQKRALLALKRRSEQRLVEQEKIFKQQEKQVVKENLSEGDLLHGINHLRERLKTLRNLYEEKHRAQIEQIKSPKKKVPKENENRNRNLSSIRSKLVELEDILDFYQNDLMNQQEEESTTYEETSIEPEDVQRLKSLMLQQQGRVSNENNDEHFDRLSEQLAAKRLELEEAKSALSRLQGMVEKIEPEQPVPKKMTKQNETSKDERKPSLLSSILSPNTETFTDVQMAAQHREIERLLESRQRLHTIKDQIASLHQTMATPTTQQKKIESSKLEGSIVQSKIREENLSLTHLEGEEDEDSEFDRFGYESGDGEEIDDDSEHQIPTRIKQTNFRAAEDIVAENEGNIFSSTNNKQNDLGEQMKDICHCLTSFINEQKTFNRFIEENLTQRAATTTSNDPIFNQFQQQVLTQGLIVNLNSAYREIALLQAEVNALQTENQRLTSSLSSVDRSNFYSRENSRESIFSFERGNNVRPQTRSRYDEKSKEASHRTANNKFENSSKTSFNSQSTGQQTAILVGKSNLETTPNQNEKRASFSYARIGSAKNSRSKLTPNSYEKQFQETQSKPFVIRRRTLPVDQENDLVQTQTFTYASKPTANSYPTYHVEDDEDQDDDDDEDEDALALEKEQQTKELTETISNIRPSALYTSTTPDFDSVDVQTLELQIKSIMVQLIPFMRLHINNVFNESILSQIRERIVFLFKQLADSGPLIRNFQTQFAEALSKTLEKYSGETICDCAGDLIREISEVTFDELVKFKLFDKAKRISATKSDDQLVRQSTNKENENFSHSFEHSSVHYGANKMATDDPENGVKYQIELAESESRPLMLIGSDEEDNDSDQEENEDSELETAVSRQEHQAQTNESPVANEVHSNGHEYVLVNRSSSNVVVEEKSQIDSTTNDENQQGSNTE